MGKRSKKKKHRGGYHKKKHSRGRSKKIPILATAGLLDGLYIGLMQPAGMYGSPISALQGTAPLTVKAKNVVSTLKNVDYVAAATPVILGVFGSWIGGKLGANKIVHKIPVIGKKVNI